ncbi:unannotated protein [freshwater metagenome]|uniref:Unannotated protein n=1 Tax=freshwater metagenome TaxID=449393 RepID=A0A6J6Q5K7_9ZZZZ
MFGNLTDDLLDLTVAVRGDQGKAFAMVTSCCSCCCCSCLFFCG